jgi:CRP-like cAMP-binding protein
MPMEIYERGKTLFSRGDQADNIYFVKEGVILLERSVKLSTDTLKEYETHYERSVVSENEATLIVKKGMVFGIDGILLKDEDSLRVSREDNPENGRFERIIKPAFRVYTARTIGRTEVYALPRQVLEGLFNMSDILSSDSYPR